MEYVIAVLLALLVRELYAWVPNLSAWLLRRAAFRVCTEERERCLEEWRAALADFPNSLVALLHAMSIFCGSATYKINSDYYRSEIELFDSEFQSVMSAHRKLAKQLKASIAGHQYRASKRSLKITTITTDEYRQHWESANRHSKSPYDDTFLEIQDCLLKLADTTQKQDELMDRPIRLLSFKLTKIEELEKKILWHRNQIGGLIERWRPNVPRVKMIDQQMREDFNVIKDLIAKEEVFEGDEEKQWRRYGVTFAKQRKRLELLTNNYIRSVKHFDKRTFVEFGEKLFQQDSSTWQRTVSE